MFALFFAGIFAAMIGLIAYELIAESRGSAHKLMDRYHE